MHTLIVIIITTRVPGIGGEDGGALIPITIRISILTRTVRIPTRTRIRIFTRILIRIVMARITDIMGRIRFRMVTVMVISSIS